MRLAIVGADSLEGERLIESLANLEQSFERIITVVADEEADVALYRGRPLLSLLSQAMDIDDIDLAICLKSSASDPALIDALVNADKMVLDASGYLAQFDDVPLWGLDAIDSPARQVAIADAVSSQVAALLAPFPAVAGIAMTVCQPVSALGRAGVETLAAETARLLNGLQVEASVFDWQLAFNCRADINAAREIEANLGRLVKTDVHCEVTTVPVFHGHTVALRIEFQEPVSAAAFNTTLAADSRFVLCAAADPEPNPVALAEQDAMLIAPVSGDAAGAHVLRTRLVADNLRKGVVLNTIEALKILIKNVI